MIARRRVRTVAVLALTVGILALTSCSSDSADVGPTETESLTADTQISDTSEPAATTTSERSVPIPAGLVGTGCEQYAMKVPMGPGSLEGMGPDPAAVAISNSPLLTTLSSAVAGKLNSEVNFVETLNRGQYTVFAPVDDAWGRVAPATIEKLKNDPAMLTSLLNYHVIEGQLTPEQVAGEHKTPQGASLKVTGSGEDFKVNDAVVLCGGIRTSNAVVYLIDAVLMPPPPGPPGQSTSGTATTTSGTDAGTSTTPTS